MINLFQGGFQKNFLLFSTETRHFIKLLGINQILKKREIIVEELKKKR